ncbi:hypothetical protein [Intestinibacter bartlettii]|uniref:hypothetical protein n=1 Tax=Intestinibacter bartlettii TaxID=261299 RepID=UPI001D10DF62|nr:hypothetical protein [Intestinibacter bartlettii]MCC2707418.1 hypothetical protein [Intestinibacter bartlettii]MCC2762867.1 hypothetical protein [Intestinibacter bartlettii]MDU6473278.1 hypothetical protein [Intestinibacter bartlettii]
MKYTMLGFSQQIAADYGLDLNDLAILRWFVDFKESGNMRSMKIDGDVYYWVFYEKISEELFIIKLQKSAIYKRLKKMCDCDILKKKTVSCGGNYSYFALGENYQELIKSQKYIKTKSPKKNNTAPYKNTTSGNDSLVDLDHDYNVNVPFESSSNEDSTQSAIFENTITKVLDHTSYDDNLGAHYNNLNLHDKNLGPHDLCLEQIINPSHSLIKKINHTQEESSEFLLSKLLWHFVKGANPSFGEPDFDLWVRDFGKILHHDHRDFVEVSELISWIFESKSFWTCHVLTPSALRKFYERVLARKNYETNRKKGASKSFFEELESQGFEPM